MVKLDISKVIPVLQLLVLDYNKRHYKELMKVTLNNFELYINKVK